MHKGTSSILFIFVISLLAIMTTLLYLKTQSNSFFPKSKKVPTATPSVKIDYRLDYSEGSCFENNQCEWTGEGCGGGHGVCTNNPEKYRGRYTTCDVNPNFPSNQGYKCGCITSLKKCGWIK